MTNLEKWVSSLDTTSYEVDGEEVVDIHCRMKKGWLEDYKKGDFTYVRQWAFFPYERYRKEDLE